MPAAARRAMFLAIASCAAPLRRLALPPSPHPGLAPLQTIQRHWRQYRLRRIRQQPGEASCFGDNCFGARIQLLACGQPQPALCMTTAFAQQGEASAYQMQCFLPLVADKFCPLLYSCRRRSPRPRPPFRRWRSSSATWSCGGVPTWRSVGRRWWATTSTCCRCGRVSCDVGR